MAPGEEVMTPNRAAGLEAPPTGRLTHASGRDGSSSAMFPGFTWMELEGGARLAIMPRPDPKRVDENLRRLRSVGVNVLVSMLQPSEASNLGLEREADAAALAGLEFLQFPVVDHSQPDDVEAALAFAEGLAQRLRDGKSIIIHCFAGIGRSATMALLTLHCFGMQIETARAALSKSRGLLVPETDAQWNWIVAAANSTSG